MDVLIKEIEAETQPVLKNPPERMSSTRNGIKLLVTSVFLAATKSSNPAESYRSSAFLLPSRQYLPVPESVSIYPARGEATAIPQNDPEVVPPGGLDPRKEYPRTNSAALPYPDEREECCDLKNLNPDSHGTSGLATLKDILGNYDRKEATSSNGTVWPYLHDAIEPPSRILELPELRIANSWENRSGHPRADLVQALASPWRGDLDPNVRPVYESQEAAYILNGGAESDVTAAVLSEDRPAGSSGYRLTKPRYTQQDVVSAISILDNFFNAFRKQKSFNSQLHPPLNPVLAVILSQYGRYVPGPQPRVYSYMAANNVHNNGPFGRYKYQ